MSEGAHVGGTGNAAIEDFDDLAGQIAGMFGAPCSSKAIEDKDTGVMKKKPAAPSSLNRGISFLIGGFSGASTEQNEAEADDEEEEEEEPAEDDPPEDNEKEEQLEATKRAKSLIKIIADLDTKVTGMLMQLPASKRTEALKSDMKYKRGDAIKFKKCLTTMLHMKGGFTLQELRKHIIKATECVKVLNNLVMLAKAHKKADQCPKTPPTKGCKK